MCTCTWNEMWQINYMYTCIVLTLLSPSFNSLVLVRAVLCNESTLDWTCASLSPIRTQSLGEAPPIIPRPEFINCCSGAWCCEISLLVYWRKKRKKECKTEEKTKMKQCVCERVRERVEEREGGREEEREIDVINENINPVYNYICT